MVAGEWWPWLIGVGSWRLGWRLVAGGRWWLVVGGWRFWAGGWWRVACGWWQVAGGWWLHMAEILEMLHMAEII